MYDDAELKVFEQLLLGQRHKARQILRSRFVGFEPYHAMDTACLLLQPLLEDTMDELQEARDSVAIVVCQLIEKKNAEAFTETVIARSKQLLQELPTLRSTKE